MPLLLSVILFVLLASLTSLLATRFWLRPKAAIDRITGETVAAQVRLAVHPSLAFRDMVARIGAVLPTPKTAPRKTGQLLIRAGYRQPGALRVLYGAKLLTALILPVLAAIAVLRTELPGDTRLFAILGSALAGYMAPGWMVGLKAKRRQRRIRRGLPDALDLLVICVESGLGLDQAIMQAAKEMELAHPDISLEFTLVNLELRAGTRRAEALRNLAGRTAVEELKKLVAVLIQADRFGTGIAQSLRTHSDYMRVQARQTAEEKAAKVGVKLVFPIFFCILPTLFVVTVGPMAVRIVREMLPMMNNL
ncbi:MAG: type II secretion system F family protein [Bryobacterales bacterium]|nr:type II secretion system F family protein [Bryobacterales bacterium]